MGQQLEQAQIKAKEKIEEANKQAQTLLEQSRRDYFSQGSKQADKLNHKLDKLKSIYTENLNSEILKHSITAAHQLITQELRFSKQAMIGFVSEALKSIDEAEEVRIRASSQDAQIIREAKKDLINLLQRATDIDIREDKNIKEGIVLQTESGVIDAQLHTQLEEITRTLGL